MQDYRFESRNPRLCSYWVPRTGGMKAHQCSKNPTVKHSNGYRYCTSHVPVDFEIICWKRFGDGRGPEFYWKRISPVMVTQPWIGPFDSRADATVAAKNALR